MREIPTKLNKYLSELPLEKKEEKTADFHRLRETAEKAGVPNPRFWAMRQVVSDRHEEEITRRLKRFSRKHPGAGSAE